VGGSGVNAAIWKADRIDARNIATRSWIVQNQWFAAQRMFDPSSRWSANLSTQPVPRLIARPEFLVVFDGCSRRVVEPARDPGSAAGPAVDAPAHPAGDGGVDGFFERVSAGKLARDVVGEVAAMAVIEEEASGGASSRRSGRK
jgi:hypothetical protein